MLPEGACQQPRGAGKRLSAAPMDSYHPFLATPTAAVLARADSHDDLARMSVPTPVMCGRDDPVMPVRDHEAMAAKIPGARLEIIANCGHLSTMEQPESVNRVLIDWLRMTDTHSVAIRAR